MVDTSPAVALSERPRIGIIGFFGETTAFRDPIPASDYRWMSYFEGHGLIEALADDKVFTGPETRGFFSEMTRLGDWEPVPLLYALSESGPQLEEAHFQSLMDILRKLLSQAGPLDGVYITGHGSVVAQQTLDTDAHLLALVREFVGPYVPIVMTLDLHGKVTPAMLQAADLFITYQTDPHIDMRERGVEAGGAMRRMLQGERPGHAYISLPIMIPTVGIVAPTSPFKEAMTKAVEAMGADGNISILPSYPLTDTPFSGFHILCSTWGDVAKAETICRDTATFLWERRQGFIPNLMPLPEFANLAARTCLDPHLPALCFADCADNPGGGGTSSTMDALLALIQYGAKGSVVGPIHAPTVAAQAHALGTGAEFVATFNHELDDPYAKPTDLPAKVLALSDGMFTARRGPAAGTAIGQGSTAALAIGGVVVVVTTRRLQAMAVEQFEIAGVDFTKVRVVVVKSRGHYQTSFSEFFGPDQMVAIDGPGWTSPNLLRWPYQRITRPLFPMDPSTSWSLENGLQDMRPTRNMKGVRQIETLPV